VFPSFMIALAFAAVAPKVPDARPVKVQQSSPLPAQDSLRLIVAAEFPELVGRSPASPPMLALLLADSTGRVTKRKAIPLTSESVQPMAVLEKEFGLQPRRVVNAVIAILEGPRGVGKGSLWVVYGRVR
jgi:hypothetical protein